VAGARVVVVARVVAGARVVVVARVVAGARVVVWLTCSCNSATWACKAAISSDESLHAVTPSTAAAPKNSHTIGRVIAVTVFHRVAEQVD